MTGKENIIRSYDQAAERYAGQFWNEFEKKPFDCMLLDWFATQISVEQGVLEIGCGPGEVSGYLSAVCVNCTGTDFSQQMILQARKYFPGVRFEVQDFFNLNYDDVSWDAVIAFYAIVNLKVAEVRQVFEEVRRVLKPGGLFVFSFHIREELELLEVEEFLDVPLNPLPFYFFDVDEIRSLVEELGFLVQDVLLRYPYPEVEYGSKRAYFVLRRGK